MVLELAKQISELFSTKIIEYNWKGVKEFGVGEDNVKVRINAREDYFRLFFSNEEKQAFIVVENNKVTSFQNPETMKNILRYMSKVSDRLIHTIFDFDVFPSFVDKNHVLAFQQEKRKEKINEFLDIYNQNMELYSLFNDMSYKLKADQVLNELKVYSASN